MFWVVRGTYEGVKLGAVVLVVVGAVHGPVSHGDDPGTGCPVLWPVGLLKHRGARAERLVTLLVGCIMYTAMFR